MMEWISVKERLPENDGWYLVYAPGYWGNSKIYGLDGFAYSNFKHNYKAHWGLERGTGRGWPGIVTHWMPLPDPPKEGFETDRGARKYTAGEIKELAKKAFEA